MNIAFILTGGNIGDRLQTLQQAAESIEKFCGHIVARSSVYETAAWGNENQPDFLNQVLQIETQISASSLLRKLLAIETNMGRQRTDKYAPRTIDLDILFYNSFVIKLPHLQVPHPQMAERRFVLEPLNEIAPDFIHPVLNQTVHQLLMTCLDPLDVKKFSV
jgi:2-amino-4-hydroxy-6-hydroxymethyldihydropteridine diphosphokinase